ncbi:MAG: tetratricopeptide repeat protein [Candidatus Aminicenantes bacterium]|nr:tetratricopeptide repeat protein [Candidatus Aminicenantes bacterium]
MKKAIVFSSVLLFAVVSLFSQTYKGKGRFFGFVYDEQGNPLEGVTVKLFCVRGENGFETKTDAEGKWVAFGVRGGQWNIDYEHPGYKPKKISAQIQEYGRNPQIDVNLEKAEGLIITAELKKALTEGNQLFDAGKYEEAIASYKGIVDEFPDAWIIMKNIGNAYFQMEDYDMAVTYYMKVLEKDPENKDVKVSIGSCYANKGETEKALEWYNKVNIEDIKDVNVLYNIGTNFYNNSQHTEALKYYKKAVELKEDFLDALYQLGLAYLAVQKWEESLKTFQEYLRHEPDPESGRAAQVRNFIEFLKTKIG